MGSNYGYLLDLLFTKQTKVISFSLKDVSPQGSKWNPLIAKRPFAHSKVTFDKRPFPHSQVTFESKRNKRPFWRLQPITDSGNEDGDYYRIATEKKLNKRPFLHSKVTFPQQLKKRPFGRLQPLIDSNEDEDDGNALLKAFNELQVNPYHLFQRFCS